MRIGLISDTHGLLRPEALAFLAGADHIVHGGDIGSPVILDRLRELAPLTVVRGNNDSEPWAHALPETTVLKVGGVAVCVVHDLRQLPRTAAAGARVIVSGHSHKPAQREDGGILYVNPGSAGPRRFSLPISVGELLVAGGEVRARIVML